MRQVAASWADGLRVFGTDGSVTPVSIGERVLGIAFFAQRADLAVATLTRVISVVNGTVSVLYQFGAGRAARLRIRPWGFPCRPTPMDRDGASRRCCGDGERLQWCGCEGRLRLRSRRRLPPRRLRIPAYQRACETDRRVIGQRIRGSGRGRAAVTRAVLIGVVMAAAAFADPESIVTRACPTR